MIDDIRIVVPYKHEPFGRLDKYISADGDVVESRKRVKLEGKHEYTIRVRSLDMGTAILVEGSFIGFLQGHNLVGIIDLPVVVTAVIRQVFQRLDFKPTPGLVRLVQQGRLKLERVDVVGFIDCQRFGGPPAVLQMLDMALAGSDLNRTIYAFESLILPACGKAPRQSFYYKAAEVKRRRNGLWQRLDPRLQAFAERYLRTEMKLESDSLAALGFREVRDFEWDVAWHAFESRWRNVLEVARFPLVRYPAVTDNSKPALLALLHQHGVDVYRLFADDKNWSRVVAEVAQKCRVDLNRPGRALDPSVAAGIDELREVTPRYGAPRSFVVSGLL